MKKHGIEIIGRTPCLDSFIEDYDGNPQIWKEDEIYKEVVGRILKKKLNKSF